MPASNSHWLDALPADCLARVQLGRHGRTGVEWQAPQVLRLHLTRTSMGQTCGLAVPVDDSADYDPRRSEEQPGWFEAEDYVLCVWEAPLGVPRHSASGGYPLNAGATSQPSDEQALASHLYYAFQDEAFDSKKGGPCL